MPPPSTRTPGAAELTFEPTREPQPNRYNLGLRFGTCYVEHCIMRTQLLLCTACRAVKYCSPEHQRSDWPRHKSQCKLIKPARDELSRLEAKLRADYAEENGDPDLDPFTDPECRGRFWFIPETRPYMQARHDVMSATLNIRSGEALEAALDHCLEMLQLCRGDNLGVRDQIPPLMLRLGRDQEAYDFIRWYMDVPDTYEWHNTELLFLDVHNADALADLSDGALRKCSLSHLACLVNLKARLVRDLRMLIREGRKLGNRTADYSKKMEWVREDACSDILYNRRDILEKDLTSLKELEEAVTTQLKKIHRKVKDKNKHYWPGLQHPERYSHALPTAYAPGSPQEVILVFRYTWYMWSEDEDTLKLVKSLGA
ncbi:hypothetical protein F5Y16DRAFT_245206 [Xylariaceae sp. FL0255]|nr:hypothetical protein F5Y16DRAFT_245206 [Xylariaceae sp. FL0255]